MAVFTFINLVSACGVLQPPARPTVYDFGPDTPGVGSVDAGLVPLVLADIDTTAALEGSAMLYRLAYSDVQQLRPYAQARWSMPPARLLQQRLRQRLGAQRLVLRPGQGVVMATAAIGLHIELEEFCQLFTTANASVGLVRVHVTLGRWLAGDAEQLLAQRSFTVQQPSPSADAAGGVRALTQASAALIDEIAAWLHQIDANLGQSPAVRRLPP